jgi:hypothetical protein
VCSEELEECFVLNANVVEVQKKVEEEDEDEVAFLLL